MSVSTPNIAPDGRLALSPDMVRVEVAAAAIVDADGRVLLSRRPNHVHQGGLWEFPGGKLEPEESAVEALVRELDEELAIRPTRFRPLIRVGHDYGDKRVVLHVFRVDAFSGTPYGREGQAVEWVPVADLQARHFPAANLPIVTSLRLPDRYLITPEPGSDQQEWLARLERAADARIDLLQMRAGSLSAQNYRGLAQQALRRLRDTPVRLLLNADPALARSLGAAGVHLSGRRLRALDRRPLGREFLVGASCHHRDDLQRCVDLGLDFAVLSPVSPTASHVGAATLGWRGFAERVDALPLPVYALGGMSTQDLTPAWAAGAQGIAAIRGLWPKPAS